MALYHTFVDGVIPSESKSTDAVFIAAGYSLAGCICDFLALDNTLFLCRVPDEQIPTGALIDSPTDWQGRYSVEETRAGYYT